MESTSFAVRGVRTEDRFARFAAVALRLLA